MKFGALTICAENPVIPGENSNGTIHTGGMFREKGTTPAFRGITFFSLLTETTEIFCTIYLDCQGKASFLEKSENLPVFCKWSQHDPIPDFGANKIPVPFDGRFFIDISAQTVSALFLKEYEYGLASSFINGVFVRLISKDDTAKTADKFAHTSKKNSLTHR